MWIRGTSHYRIKLVKMVFPLSGNDTPALMPAYLHFKSHAIFLPNMRIVRKPTESFFGSFKSPLFTLLFRLLNRERLWILVN